MVVASIIGGLGNQMFMYAAARRLALKHSTELFLDTTGFKHYFRNYGLGCFRIQARPICEAQRRGRLTIWREPHFEYSADFERLPDDVWLLGYFQSERYFTAVDRFVRMELALAIAETEICRCYRRQIEMTESVSVHVRRGDYVQRRSAATVHSVLGLDYYQECESRISAVVANPHFFVFSDDTEWARCNLRFSAATTIVETGRDYEDLVLMSECRHHIIANSTFSWWGAWLDSRPGKTVLAPRTWFEVDLNTEDLVPAAWVRV